MKAPTIVGLQFKSSLEVRHGTTPAELQTLIKPLFLWMYDHDVQDLQIARDDKKAQITVDGQQQGSTVHPDDAAVDRFAVAMKAKLATARAKGRRGWNDSEMCADEYLSDLLRGHVTKGDPVDVANFAMMLHQRGSGIIAAQGKEPFAYFHHNPSKNPEYQQVMPGAAGQPSIIAAYAAPQAQTVEQATQHLLEVAQRADVIVTIERRPLQPLAMGHAGYVVETRPVRGAS